MRPKTIAKLLSTLVSLVTVSFDLCMTLICELDLISRSRVKYLFV